MCKHHDLSNFVWSIADILRRPNRPPQDERVLHPLVVHEYGDMRVSATRKTFDNQDFGYLRLTVDAAKEIGA